MDYPALSAELKLTTPLNYTGLSDAAAAAQLNSTSTGRSLARKTVAKNELLTAIVDAEWPATAVLQNKLLCIFCCDNIDASSANVRALFAAIFGPATVTRANLLALGSQPVSRAVELGLGPVLEVDVKLARAGNW